MYHWRRRQDIGGSRREIAGRPHLIHNVRFVKKASGVEAESRSVRFWKKGQCIPSPPARGMGERCKLPSEVRGKVCLHSNLIPTPRSPPVSRLDVKRPPLAKKYKPISTKFWTRKQLEWHADKGHVTKNSQFRKSKMADGRHIKIVKSSYLSEKSSDFDEIWYTTADIDPDDSHVIKKKIF